MKAKVTYNTATATGKIAYLDSNMPLDTALSDEKVTALMADEEVSPMELKFARILLKKEPNATDISVAFVETAKKDNEKNPGAMILALILAVVLLIIFLPLLVILGMHGKLFLKSFYENRTGEGFAKFKKVYMIIGIVLYAVAAALIVVGALTSLSIGIGIAVLAVGAIVYGILSLILTKKYVPAVEK